MENHFKYTSKNESVRKILVLIVAVVMVFSVTLLVACNSVGWQDEFRAIQEEVFLLEDSENVSFEQIATLQEQLLSLRDSAESNGQLGQVRGLQTRITALSNGETNMSFALENKIRETFFRQQNRSNLSMAEVYISRYFGTFNGATVCIVQIVGDGVGDAIWEEEVAGIVFTNIVYVPIRVFYNNAFFSLSHAYLHNLLTIDDLLEIANR